MGFRKRNAVLLFLTFTIVAIGLAQNPAGAGLGANTREPQPEAAARAILTAFNTFRVVAIGDYHFTRDLDDFVLSLVRHPEFPNTVNDIVIENINSLHQPLLDRYIAGEDVPAAEARRLWREVWSTTLGVQDFDVQLFQLVRQINRKLPPARRLRVLAGEPPKDWSKPGIRGATVGIREEHIASVVEQEVLAKNRKALMFYGIGHLVHGGGGTKSLYERKYPGVTFVVEPYFGRCDSPAELDGTLMQVPQPLAEQWQAQEAKMGSWPVPSLVHTKGTWLADLAQWKWTTGFSGALRGKSSQDPIDAYLYLGPPDLLLAVQPSVFTFTDRDYLADIRSRQGASLDMWGIRLDPDKVRQLENNVLRCDGTRLVER